MKTMFDPEGRIDPASFRDAAMILIVIGAVFSLLPMVVGSAATYLSFISLVLLYPWAVIWVKRLHDAGKSGWMFVAVLVAWIAVGGAAGWLISKQFAPPQGPTPTNLSDAMAFAASQAQATALPHAIAGVVISLLFVLLGNALLKSDPGPNAYDPPAHLR